MSQYFNAFVVSKSKEGEYRHAIEKRNLRDLPDYEVLVRVRYSSLNYKDALSATIHRGITRHYPHTPGIDAAGEIVDGGQSDFQRGDRVIVTSYDLGMNTPGGFGEYIRVPGDWIVPLPEKLTLRESMILGTAGFTAALSLWRLRQLQSNSEDSTAMIVTGATGGVGSLAVLIGSLAGYSVTAVTGKKERHDWLRSLGATNVISRNELPADPDKPLLSGRWNSGIDTVGGPMLAQLLKSMTIDGAVACCGNVGGDQLSTSIYPFILRGIGLLGVDSGNCPISKRKKIWQKLSDEWKPRTDQLKQLSGEIGLRELSDVIHRMLEGKVTGRKLIKH